jgi:hypothetical protein
MPRWKFQPTKKLVDAIRLLEAAKPAHYAMESVGGGKFRVQVEIGGKTGKACDTSKPRAITYAIARALGLDVPDEAPSSLATKPLRGQQGQTR